MDISPLLGILLGVVEGLTEFIPVSSTAHLIIAQNLAHIPLSKEVAAFTVAIQGGAILAALWYFGKMVFKEPVFLFKVAVAFVPTALVGLLFSSQIHQLFGELAVIGWVLIAGGIIFLFLPKRPLQEEKNSFSWKEALMLGLFQVVAFVPGVSRSGALLIGGTLSGMHPGRIALFSFTLAVPTILGATGVELWGARDVFSQEMTLALVIGGLVAFVVASMTMRFFLKFLEKKHALSYFGIYRIIIGIFVLVFLV